VSATGTYQCPFQWSALCVERDCGVMRLRASATFLPLRSQNPSAALVACNLVLRSAKNLSSVSKRDPDNFCILTGGRPIFEGHSAWYEDRLAFGQRPLFTIEFRHCIAFRTE